MKTNKLIMILCFMSAGSVWAQETATLRLKVTNFKNQSGTVRVALYANEADYMEKYFRVADTTVYNQNGVEVIFNQVPQGEYAVTLYHDQNGNEKLDTNFMGIPSEPYGFSNNPPSRFGAPSYEQAVFNISQSEVIHHIKLN